MGPGADGLVRVLQVQTNRGVFDRAIQQIVPLFKESSSPRRLLYLNQYTSLSYSFVFSLLKFN